jgi:hypothetical protein
MTDAARTLRPDTSHAEPSTPPSAHAPALALRTAGWLTVVSALLGLALTFAVARSREAAPHTANIYFSLFARLEPWPLALLLGFGLLLALAPRPTDRDLAATGGAGDAAAITFRLPVSVLAGLAAVAAAVLWFVALHATTFSMDEFAADFQAQLFGMGRVFGDVPLEWRPIVRWLRPIFVAAAPDGSHWVATYTPGYALLRAPFQALGAAWLLNPLLGGAAVLLVHRVALALWPGERRWAWIAAALLALSTQVLMTSASAYAMPAHLTLNLAWLALYLRRSRAATVALGPVGALAFALHNPFPHALFVAPFMIRLLRERRWRTVGYLTVAYGVTAVGILAWLRMVQRFETYTVGGSSFANVFGLPDKLQLLTVLLAGVLLLGWHTPVCVAGWFAALRRPRTLPAPLVDAAIGVALTLVFYLFFPYNQGHGWGYRYSYAVVGNLMLLAVAGLRTMAASEGERRVGRLVALSLGLSLVVQLPLRAVQVAGVVRPLAASLAFIQAQPADVVTVPVEQLWYGLDLLRNDPLLRNRPVVVHGNGSAALDSLLSVTGRRLRVVRPEELTALGMKRVVPIPNGGYFW